MQTLGAIIVEKRKLLGLSQKELTELVRKEDGQPITQQFLSDIEKDNRKPSEFVLNRLADALQISPDILWLSAGLLPPHIRNGVADAALISKLLNAVNEPQS